MAFDLVDRRLYVEPKLFVGDNFGAGGDAAMRARLFSRIDVFVAGLAQDEATALATLVVEAQGAPADIITTDLVERVFGVRCRIIEDPESGTPLVVPAASRGPAARERTDQAGPAGFADAADTPHAADTADPADPADSATAASAASARPAGSPAP